MWLVYIFHGLLYKFLSAVKFFDCTFVVNLLPMKFLSTLFIALTAAAWTAPCADARTVTPLCRDWLFMAGDADGAQNPSFNDSQWQHIDLPHDFQISQPWVAPGPDEMPDLNNPVANVRSRLSSRGFKEMGTGWYRKQFDAPAEWRGQRVLLDFGGIMLVGDVWINGQPAGSTDYGYLGFETDITNLIRYDAPNVIAVRANTGKPENSRWYTGGGLYRDVKIVTTDPQLYFARHPLYITTPTVGTDSASVRVQAEISCPGLPDMKQLVAVTEITDPAGRRIYSNQCNVAFNPKQPGREYLIDSIGIANPALWSCEQPNLYTMTVSLIKPDGSVADKVSQNFGIRTIEYSPEFGLKLNGRKVLLKGIANHHTLGALGAAAYPAAIEKRIKLLKDFGFNHIRCSHNPYSQEFMDLCDKYGMLVVDEIYDKWLTQYAGGRTDWMQQWPKDLPEWLKRDRNHPSVVMWSLGNELQLIWELPFNDWGVTPYRMQKALVDRFDRTRPVTVAMHPRGRHQTTDSLPAPLVMETDIAAYNYRYMYFPGDSRRFPNLIFYQSEANASNMGPNFFDMNLDKVIGLAYWGMIDYLGESNGWPEKGWTNGVFDISLRPKPNAYFLRSFFKPDEPLVHIGIIDNDNNTVWNDVKVGTKQLSDHWNRTPGSAVDLFTYTNADEVELLVNGRSQGRRANDTVHSQARNRILWKAVPFAPGSIEAVAYRKGSATPVARHRIETANAATRLSAQSDNPAWKADGTDLQHIAIEAVDSKGRRDPGASQLLTFEVEGPAQIAGVINGDMTSPELTVGSSRSLYQGAASVILRSTQTPGNVTLKISAPGFKTIKKTFKTL